MLSIFNFFISLSHTHSHFFKVFFPPFLDQIPISFAYDLSTTPFLPFSIQSHSSGEIHSPKNSTLEIPPYLSSSRDRTIPFPRKSFQSRRQSTTQVSLSRNNTVASTQLDDTHPSSPLRIPTGITASLHDENTIAGATCKERLHASLSTTWNLSFSIRRFFIQKKSVYLFFSGRRILSSFFSSLSLPPSSLSLFFFLIRPYAVSRERINRGSFEQLGRN